MFFNWKWIDNNYCPDRSHNCWSRCHSLERTAHEVTRYVQKIRAAALHSTDICVPKLQHFTRCWKVCLKHLHHRWQHLPARSIYYTSLQEDKRKNTGESGRNTFVCQGEHIKRAAFQAAHIWGQLAVAKQHLPIPSKWGWTMDSSGRWIPLWTTLPEPAQLCKKLIKCSCKNAWKASLQVFQCSTHMHYIFAGMCHRTEWLLVLYDNLPTIHSWVFFQFASF